MASQEPEDLELVEVPKVGMSFPSIEDAFDMVQKYAFSVGFGFVKFSHSTNKAGICVYHKFACHKGGTRKERNYKRERKRPVARTNCPAKVNLAQREGGRWKITQVNVEHNHDMDPRNSRFLNAHRTVPSLLKRRFEMFDATGVKMSKVIRAVTAEAGGPENMPCLPRDCRNYVDKARRERFGGVDAEALYILFTRMQKVSRDFYFEIDATVDGRMKNVFWIDDRSRAAYKEFNDVVTFDTTYLLNKYKMPFAPFVGVNHHGHSILLGCALISNEEAKTFEWLFKTWLQAMGGKAPEAIITDQCPSIGKGISIVFPHARHRWCLWHILVKFPEKCGGFKKYDELRKAFLDVVYENLIVDEFENKWAQMIKDFKLEENNWFQTLYEGREKWVPVFLKDKFWAGMSSSQRSESMNAYFDGYVHSKTPLKSFVEQYEMALGDKIEKEIFADAQCMNADIRCMTTFEMEKQFQKAYTHNLFKKVQDELMAMVYCEADLAIEDSLVFEYKVTERNDIGGGKVIMKDYKVLFDSSTMEVNCICRLFDWKGFLCRHAFKVLFKRNLTLVHERYILRRWRKDVEREHGNIKLLGIGGKWTSEMERSKRIESKFYSIIDNVIDSIQKCHYVENVIENVSKDLLDGTWIKSLSGEIVDNQDTPNVENVDKDVEDHSPIKYSNPDVVRKKGREKSKARRSLGETLRRGKKKDNQASDEDGEPLKRGRKKKNQASGEEPLAPKPSRPMKKRAKKNNSTVDNEVISTFIFYFLLCFNLNRL